jgi:SAM-dependent methyltransferase
MKGVSKERAFFYAEEEAATYDVAAQLTQPQYHLLHSAMVELLAYHFRKKPPRTVRGSILDLGCGTGVEALGVAAAFPEVTVVAVDFSQPMLDVCAKEFQRQYGARSPERCKLARIDLLGEDATGPSFLRLLPSKPRPRTYLAVITAFTFHHFTMTQKRRLYLAVFDILAPGGLFLNGDLFLHQSKTLAGVVLEHTERWIERQFSDPNAEFAKNARALGARTLELKEKWLEHVRRYNCPTPMEGPSWAAQERRNVGAATGDVETLRQVGFAEVGCPFRYFQEGIVWARK